jgi:hypothetical protein
MVLPNRKHLKRAAKRKTMSDERHHIAAAAKIRQGLNARAQPMKHRRRRVHRRPSAAGDERNIFS